MRAAFRDNSIAACSMEPLSEKQTLRQQHVLQAKLHNGSLADYAKLRQLKVTTLYYWVGLFNRSLWTKKPAVAATYFSSVRVSSPVSATPYYIHLSSRLTLQCTGLPQRSGYDLSRQTLARRMIQAAELLQPLHNLLRDYLLSGYRGYLSTDGY